MNKQPHIEEDMDSSGAPGSSVLRNAAWLAWSGAIGIVNGVVLWMAMARWREASEVGQFSTVMSVYTIFMTLCSLGLSSYLASEIARRKERRQFVASAIVLVGAWSLVSAAGMALAGYVLNQSPSARSATIVLSLAMLPTGLISVAEAVFIALGRARVIALATTSENLLRSVIPLFLLYRGETLVVICFSIVLIRLMACVAYAIVARRELGALREASWPFVSEIIKVTPTFAGVTILASVHWQIGTVLVNALGGEEAAAEFGVASRFMIPVTLLLTSYVNVLQPVASRLAANSLPELGPFLSRSLRVVMAFCLPLAVGSALLGRELVVLLFGAPYAGASVALGLLGLGVIPFSIVMVAARGLVATGRQRVDLLANLVAVVSNIAGNLALIPLYGASGAAAAQLISVTAMAAVEVGYGLRPRFELHIWRAIWICRWPLLAMIAVIWPARALGFGWALLAGGASYLIGLSLIWDRIRPSRQDADGSTTTENDPRPRVLMVGAHPTKTLGGISTLISDILNSRLTQEFEFRHIVSQVDEYARLGKLALAIKALVHFVAHLIRWRPQLVYVHVGGNSSLHRKTVFIALARLAGRRVISHFHAGNFESYFARQSVFGRKLILWGLGRSNQFIAVSHETARMLGKRWPEVETAVVPNGINTELFAPAPAEVRATGQNVRLLFVGKMGFLKGEQDLIRALQCIINATPQFPPQYRPQFRLDMLGQLSGTIEELCHESGLRPLIDHLGPVSLDERIAFFKRADIFILPTYAEGLPIAALEAMAAGLPVITTPVGGIPELVDDGVEGYLVEPGDAEALADRIAYLIYDPEQRQLMGRRAQAKARQFDWSIVLAQLGMELRQAVKVIRAHPARVEEKGRVGRQT